MNAHLSYRYSTFKTPAKVSVQFSLAINYSEQIVHIYNVSRKKSKVNDTQNILYSR